MFLAFGSLRRNGTAEWTSWAPRAKVWTLGRSILREPTVSPFEVELISSFDY